MSVRVRAGALLAGFMVLMGAAPAQAHESLRGTSPEAGSWVAERPAEVRLTFVTAPGTLGAAAAVTGPGGVSVAAGPARLDGDTLVVPLMPAGDGDAGGGAGAYTVVWRVTSVDGHPLSGRFSFGVGEPGSASLPADEGASPSTTATQPSSDGARLVVWAAAGAGGLGIVLLLVVRVVLARREGGANAGDGPAGDGGSESATAG